MIALTYESEIYMYLRNAQNDIIGLLDKDGKVVVRYTYDSWGQVVKIEGTLKDKVGARNPFRYKGYYYDVETGLYYCRSRYYDPAIRRFISADDTQVLRDNLDMLGEKNLYAYCDDNPITRSDSDGQLWHKLVEIAAGAVIGAAVNVITGGIAATVTGQKYTALDIFFAAFSGGVAGAGSAIGGGIISALYAGVCSFIRGDSLSMIALNTGMAFGATTYIGNLTGFTGLENIPKKIDIAWGLTYGFGANLLAAGVSAGTSSIDSSEVRGLINTISFPIHVSLPVPKGAIGQKRTYNGKSKTYATSFIYRSPKGRLTCIKRKSYHSGNACTV